MSDPKPEKPRHFSMLRDYTPADVLTLANAACGTLTIFLCLRYLEARDPALIWGAFGLLPAAFVFDALDGWVARKTNKASRIGADLDSLADIVSFGVAPAVLGFTLGLRGALDVLLLVYFVCCGISRLARFNVTAEDLQDAETGKVSYFEGTPIPTSLALVMGLAVLFSQSRVHDLIWLGAWDLGGLTLHPLTLAFAVSGSLMISATVRIPKP